MASLQFDVHIKVFELERGCGTALYSFKITMPPGPRRHGGSKLHVG